MIQTISKMSEQELIQGGLLLAVGAIAMESILSEGKSKTKTETAVSLMVTTAIFYFAARRLNNQLK